MNQDEVQAKYKPSTSQVQAKYKPSTSQVQAKYKLIPFIPVRRIR
ncbi:hypothetical protein GCM10008022_33480 [Paenibacillus hunanensis]|nr:hypothetical protein GCM10008022_33480 [Paenibacillus hunanensis]